MVHMREDAGSGPEIRGNLDDIVGPAPGNGGFGLTVRDDVGAAKAINGLLGVADHEQRAWPQLAVGPRVGALLGGDQKQDLALDRVGILEFVDENVPIPVPERQAHGLVATHKRAGAVQQIVKIQHRRGALKRVVGGDDLVELLGQDRDQIACNAAEQGPVALIGAGEELFGLVPEPRSFFLAGRLYPRGFQTWGS
jgi:hypothetical protein